MNNILYEIKKLEKLKRSLQRQQKDLSSQSAAIEDLLASIEVAERIKLLPQEGATISYRLGKILIDAKSWQGFLLLPKRLYSLRVYAKERKSNNSTGIKVKTIGLLDSNSSPKKIVNEKTLIVKPKIIKTDTILTLVDSFSFENYQKLFPAYYLMSKNNNQISSTKAFLFLVESAWLGHEGQWKYGLISPNFKHPKALEVLDAVTRLKERNVPIVFLYREAMQNYQKFLSMAKESDIVITCNESALNQFKIDLPEKKIYFIDNFTNEYLCKIEGHPRPENKDELVYIGEFESPYNNDDDVLMGTYLIKDNIKGLSLIKKESSNKRSYGLSNLNGVTSVSDTVSQADLIEIIRKHKFMLNLANPFDHIVPRKVLAALAVGVPVISTRSVYLEEKFKDVIQFIDDPAEVQPIVEKYNDRWQYSRLAHLGHRYINNNYLSRTAKQKILSAIKGVSPRDDEKPLVSIIMASMREKYIDRIVTNISRQVYPNKEFIIVTQNFSADGILELREKLGKMKGFVSFKIIENNTTDTLGERQNLAISHAVGEYVAKFDDDDFYFSNYLMDMIKPFSFGDYDMVGKAEFFIYLEGLNQTVLIRDGKAAYREMDFVSGATFVIKKKVFDALKGFSSVNQSEDSDLLKRLKANGGKIYSADPYNFVVFRSANVTEHTWQQKAEAFAKSCTFVCEGIDENIVSV